MDIFISEIPIFSKQNMLDKSGTGTQAWAPARTFLTRDCVLISLVG